MRIVASSPTYAPLHVFSCTRKTMWRIEKYAELRAWTKKNTKRTGRWTFYEPNQKKKKENEKETKGKNGDRKRREENAFAETLGGKCTKASELSPTGWNIYFKYADYLWTPLASFEIPIINFWRVHLLSFLRVCFYNFPEGLNVLRFRLHVFRVLFFWLWFALRNSVWKTEVRRSVRIYYSLYLSRHKHD